MCLSAYSKRTYMDWYQLCVCMCNTELHVKHEKAIWCVWNLCLLYIPVPFESCRDACIPMLLVLDMIHSPWPVNILTTLCCVYEAGKQPGTAQIAGCTCRCVSSLGQLRLQDVPAGVGISIHVSSHYWPTFLGIQQVGVLQWKLW